MLAQSLKKLIRMRDPIFVGTDDPKVFDIQTVPYYVVGGKEFNLAPVMLSRVKIVEDPEQSDTFFSAFNHDTQSSDIVYVKFIK
jgi:hypothetical protein